MPRSATRLCLALLLLGTAIPAFAGPRRDRDDDDDRPRRTVSHAPKRPVAKPAPEGSDDDDDRPAPAAKTSEAPAPAPAKPTTAAPDNDDDRTVANGVPAKADADNDDDDERGPDAKRAIVVTGRRLDAASQRFDRALGASVYALANSSIEQRPGSEFGTLGQVLQQFPGSATGPAGRLTIRGVTGATEVRINNAILPGDGSELIERLSTRLAGSVSLVRGALPAQFGPGASAIVSLRAKTGHDLTGGQAELQLGTSGILEPAFEWAGSGERSSLFITGNAFRSNLGRPSPEPVGYPDHDRTKQYSLFGYGEQLLGANTRVALIAGADDDRFELPNSRALAPLGLDGRSRDANRFAVLSLQHAAGQVQLQATVSRGWQTSFTRPDPRLAAVSEGPVQQLHRRGHSSAVQLEAGWAPSEQHQLRAGVLLRGERDEDRTDTFGLTAAPVSSSEMERSWSRGAFVSDEWRPVEALTVTGGLRVDRLRGHGSYWQPRLGVSLTPGRGVTVHAGYARTVLPTNILRAGAALLAGGRVSDPPPERDDNLEAGASWSSGGFTLDVTAYRRRMRDALDLALLSGRPEPVAFSFTRGRARGVEAALTYARGPWSAWANAALSKGWGRGQATGAALFTPAEQATINAERVPLSTIRPWTLSGGLVQRFGRFTLSGDVVHQAGLPEAGGGRIAGRIAPLTRVDAAANLRVKGLAGHGLDLRLELTNAFGAHDPLSPGRGLVAQPGYSTGRTLALVLEQGF